MNNMSLKNIQNLFKIEQSSRKFLGNINNKKESIININGNKPLNEIETDYEIHLDICKYFRKQMYGLNDNSFSIFANKDNCTTEDHIIILPFHLKYYQQNYSNFCIYALKLSFKSSNESLEIDPVFIPYLKSQNKTEIDQIDLSQIVVDNYLIGKNSELVIYDNLVFLFLKVKVKSPNPSKIHIQLEFNNDSGITFFNELESINISFQDLFYPSPNDNWELICYHIIKDSKISMNYSNHEKLSIINSTKILDIPSFFVNDQINKCLNIFEVNANKLKSLINDEFSISEEFDFKHDLLINQLKFKSDNNNTDNNIQIQFRWFCIHLFPKYHLILQFSITDNVSIIRLYTDIPDILPHCDQFFDSWLIN